VNTDRQLAASEDRSTELRLRRFVRTHGIESDVNQHRGELAGFLYFENVAAFVRTALRACAMGKLALMAAGALGGAGCGQRIMGATLGGAGLGVTPLWIRHFKFLSRFLLPALDGVL
jgi:hypothetical protein